MINFAIIFAVGLRRRLGYGRAGPRCVEVAGDGSPAPVIFFVFLFSHHFYFPAQLVGGFTLSDLLDKPWSQVSSLLPPGTCLLFLSRIGLSIPAARRFSSKVANSRSRAFRLSIFYARKSLYEHALGET